MVEIVSIWVSQDTRRFLHAVYRVGDLDKTIEFYKANFGFKQIRYRDIPEVCHKPIMQMQPRQIRQSQCWGQNGHFILPDVLHYPGNLLFWQSSEDPRCVNAFFVLQ